MRARYTAKDQKPVDVEVREFVERSMKEESGIDLRPPPFDRDKVAAMLARLVEVLAEKDALSGGEVLAVLGFTDGQLDLDDGTPRTDAEWRDYWAESEAAGGKERERAILQAAERSATATIERDSPARQPVESGEVPFGPRVDLAGPLRPMIDHASELASALACSTTTYPCDISESELGAELDRLVEEVAELRRESTKRGELLSTIRGVLFGDKFADPLPAYLRRDLVLSIVERIGVKP
jgi:hypothetical protein